MQSGYAPAKTVYQELRSAVAPWTKSHGFRRWAGTQAGWRKTIGAGQLLGFKFEGYSMVPLLLLPRPIRAGSTRPDPGRDQPATAPAPGIRRAGRQRGFTPGTSPSGAVRAIPGISGGTVGLPRILQHRGCA